MTPAERENIELKARLAAAEARLSRLTATMAPQELDRISAAMTRADAVAAKFGGTASRPITGETSLQYRRRLLGAFQKHSPAYRNADCDRLGEDLIAAVEDRVYADAVAAATDSDSYPPGTLRPIQERDESGRLITKFVGDISAFMAPFMTAGNVGRFIRNPNGN